MEDITNKNIVKSVDAVDLVIGTGMKPIVESVASPVVGNGNAVSGVAKLTGAYLTAKYAGNNRIGKGAAIGAGMDGAEDMIVAIKNKIGLNQTPNISGGVF